MLVVARCVGAIVKKEKRVKNVNDIKITLSKEKHRLEGKWNSSVDEYFTLVSILHISGHVFLGKHYIILRLYYLICFSSI